MSSQINTNVKTDFVTDIQHKIFTGELQVGTRLESERALAQTYQISKTMIHDGLSTLCDQGFLKAYPRKGYVVENFKKTGNIACLNAYLHFRSNQLDETTFDSLIEAILAIEGSAIVKLSNNHTQDDINELNGIRSELERVHYTNLAQLSQLFYKFNSEICYLSKNTLFPLLFNSFQDLLIVFNYDFVEEYGKDNCLKVMHYLIDAIEKKQGQQAYNLLGNMLRQFRLALRHHNKFAKG